MPQPPVQGRNQNHAGVQRDVQVFGSRNIRKMCFHFRFLGDDAYICKSKETVHKDEELIYQIGLTLLKDVGPVSVKKLVAFCGGAREVFTEKKKFLQRIPGIHRKMVESVVSQDVLGRAEVEVGFMRKHEVRPLFYLSPEYPERLRHCADSPVMLYYRGNGELNNPKVVAVVGTRLPSQYGLQQCETLLSGIAPYQPLIVSGLAYGIDACAHKSALKEGLPTIGVMAHGLDRIYPPVHRYLAAEMVGQGGLLTDYPSGTNPDKQNFPSRNRIVAGMADVVIVIESGVKGGALITADIANSYSRDVFAIPGRNSDNASSGCNLMISENRAGILLSADHLATLMGWKDKKRSADRQQQIFINLSDDEERIVNIIRQLTDPVIDQISLNCGIPVSRTASLLLELELKGVLRCQPGKKYTLA
jgi:DNA processing protein